MLQVTRYMLHDKKGFSLIEVLVAVGVFVIFAMGIYSGIQYVFKVVYNSRLRIIETSILNEQVEVIRNMSWYDVGIVDGSPSGVLSRTVTTTRNGIDFEITRTIRNIDDEFDGTIGGTPNDTAPADYKMVDISIICSHCQQQNPVSVTTYVAPKNLEGDPDHGALFIEVFDANAEPVQGAEVHIVSTSTDPTLDMTDTTDNEGMLRLVDLGFGTDAYSITVTKDGYTTAQTMSPTAEVPNPVKTPASVVAQDVTSISFSIDEVSTINLSTENSYCSAVGSVDTTIRGTKLFGTNPSVLKVNDDVTTNGSGLYTFSNMEWDSYAFLVDGSYDLIGTIPALPLSILPGVTQSIQLILGSNTINSLLVNVADSITGQPISNAVVELTATGYDGTETTGVGHINQTDWSGGSGQLNFTNNDEYWSDDGNVDVTTSAGDITLQKSGGYYANSGSLESSVFDLGTSVNLVNLIWAPFSQPAQTGASSLKFQIATSNTSTPATWEYLGPDGTASTYYDENTTEISDVHDNDQFFRYQVFLTTASTTYTPMLSDLSVTYTTSCTPPGQAYFGGLSNQEYTVSVSADGYQPSEEAVTVSGDMIFTVDMVSL